MLLRSTYLYCNLKSSLVLLSFTLKGVVLDVFSINEDKINFETVKENNYLKNGLKLNKLDILFKKIEKND